MKSLFLAFWSMTILIMTCTTRFELVNGQLAIYFNWTSNPVYQDFLLELPTTPSEGFILQKIGHVIAFSILAILLILQLNKFQAMLFSLAFALMTETLQLYLSRGGRLFDVGFDFIGILLGLAVVVILEKTIPKEQHPTTLKR